MRRAIATAVAAAVIASVFALPASAVSREPGSTLGEQITTNIAYDWRGWDYDIIGNVVGTIVANAESLDTALGAALDPNAELTVFLPNDWAMKRLAYDLTGKWVTRESQVIPALLKAVEPLAMKLGVSPLQVINEVVEYHVVGGSIDSSAALDADGATIDTVQGASFVVDVISKSRAVVRLMDNDPDLRDPYLVRWDLDNFASNGVWHGISRVLIPLDI